VLETARARGVPWQSLGLLKINQATRFASAL